MGINKQSLSLMLHEHKYKPITGEYLSLGKQTVTLPREVVRSLFVSNSLEVEPLDAVYADEANIDTVTRHGSNYILDHSLISAFSDCHYNCLDVSDYEGADIIHDMNTPIGEQHYGKYDFIYNGSCMDNIFDPVSFIKNTSRMLAPNGRVMHIECATALAGAYLSFSPEWFFSYYAANGFKDCKVYAIVARESSGHAHLFDTDLFVWNPYFTRSANYDYINGCKSVNGLMYLLVIAEKQESSTSDTVPMQSHYLRPTDTDWRKRYEDFCKVDRKILQAPQQKEHVALPLLSDHFHYIGSGF